MLEGKVRNAIRVLTTQDGIGVAPINDETTQILRDKHPEQMPADSSILIQGPKVVVNPITFA